MVAFTDGVKQTYWDYWKIIREYIERGKMNITRVESGLYRTEDYKYTAVQDWTSVNGGMRLVKCWKVYRHSDWIKTCKTIGEAKDYIRLQYV